MKADAQYLAAYGLLIHPLRPRSKAPAVSGWQALRMDADAIDAYWDEHPDANVGLICGAAGGWVVLDLDGDEWVEWARANMPLTPLRTISGSGHGGHWIYRWPVGVPIAKRKISVAALPDSRRDRDQSHKGADLYGDGTQVVLPPSVHPSGGLYRWDFDGELPPIESVPVFELAWLPQPEQRQPELTPPAREVGSRSQRGSSEVGSRSQRGSSEDLDSQAYKRASAWMAKRAPAVQGNRGDDHTYITACELVHGFGLSDGEALQLLIAWNATCQPPWSDSELRAKVSSARRTGQGSVKEVRQGVDHRAQLEAGLASWRATTERTGIGAQLVQLDAELEQIKDELEGVDADGVVQQPAAKQGKQNKARKLVLPVREKGKPAKDHVRNTAALCEHYGISVRYNLMSHELELTIPGYSPHRERSANATIDWLENRAAEHGLSRFPIVKHLNEMAQEYHPVLDWVRSRPWDGADRIAALLASVELQRGADTELCGLLMVRWLLGAAAAILPDFDGRFAAQGVLVYQGEQGRHKTRWLRSLAPVGSPWILTGRMLDPRDRDSVQAATSVWLTELGEVDATFRRSDIAALKAFVTQESDTFRAAYAKREERRTRRTVFFASVNHSDYLVDTTGNRRWWTVPIERCHADHGIDTQQLWAQLVELALAPDARWWLDDGELERLAEANSYHEPDDALASEVRDCWRPIPFEVARPPRGVSLADIVHALPSFASKTPTPAETHRIVQALRDCAIQSVKDKRGRRYYAERIERAEPQPATRSGWGGY